jgi:crossover junction endodeoxyribonuclease RuvC
VILACDPGLSGAFCFYDPKLGRMDVESMPTYARIIKGQKTKRKTLDEHGIFDLVGRYAKEGAVHLYIEQVGGRPGQAAAAAFNFGQGYGAVRMAAVAAGLSIEAVPPATWKAALRVPAEKFGARQRASEMIPTHRHLWPRKCDDGKAEAALLALYAQRHLNGGVFDHRTKKDQRQIDLAAAARAASVANKKRKAAATKARLAAVADSDNPDMAASLF